MRERALIHVAGPAGAGKTAFIEALLAEGHALILAARCRRDDSLHQPRETAPSAHPELRRYRQAGATCGCRKPVPLGKCLAERGRAFGAWPAGGALSGGGMIFGLWA